MTETYIAPFMFSEDLNFIGAHSFSNGSIHMLINKSGYIIILDDMLIKQITSKNISDDLCLKLIQRKFVCIKDEVIEESVSEIKPTLFMIDLTDKCNMSCLYCLRNCNSSDAERIISSEKIHEICDYIVKYCKNYNLDSILVQPWGGEPLLEKNKIFSIQDFLMQAGLRADITIETNGTLLTDELVKELWNRHIYVSVSIDGYESVHDSQRVFNSGRKTHNIVESSIRLLQKYYDDNVSVIATMTRNSIPYIEQIIKYFAEELHLKKIKINFVHKSSFSDNNDLCLEPEEIRACTRSIFNTIINLHKQGIHIFEYNLFIKLKNLLLCNKSDVCCSRGCTGGKNMITFDYDGNIYPCDVTDFPEVCLGNIQDGDMVDIIRNSLDNPYFKEKYSPDCMKCPWFFYCRGGCTVHTMCNGKQLGDIDDIECNINKELYPHLVELILTQPELVNQLLYNEEDGGLYVE